MVVRKNIFSEISRKLDRIFSCLFLGGVQKSSFVRFKNKKSVIFQKNRIFFPRLRKVTRKKYQENAEKTLKTWFLLDKK